MGDLATGDQIMGDGTLDIMLGPMFSGKTTWLNGVLTELADAGFRVLKINHAADLRLAASVSDPSGTTHHSGHVSLSPLVHYRRTVSLSEVRVDDYHVVGVDEAQFFTDLLTTVDRWIKAGKHVRVASLDGDSTMRPFGQILSLIPLCDHVHKLHARCHYCLLELRRLNFRGNLMSIEAPFTLRVDESTEQQVIGGADKYRPVCRYHHAHAPPPPCSSSSGSDSSSHPPL